jgi:cell division septum initiation protein DivIVA
MQKDIERFVKRINELETKNNELTTRLSAGVVAATTPTAPIDPNHYSSDLVTENSK